MSLPRVNQKADESRMAYLSRVLCVYADYYGYDGTIIFDEAECDLYCLAEDIKNEVES